MPSGSFTSASPTLTVQALLAQPRRISRDLVNLVSKRLVGDRLLVRGSEDQVRGGSMVYQEDESIFPDDDPLEIAEDADWPRTTYTEAVKTALVKQYGLEQPVSNLAIRRNQIDRLRRAERKLANGIVKFIDSKVFSMIQDSTAVHTFASAALWTAAATDIIAEVVKAQELIEVEDKGYNGFEDSVLVLHTKRRDDLLKNTGLRDALPRETNSGQIRTGQMAPFLGLGEILFSSQIAEASGIVMDRSVAGTIADERPSPEEGFTAYDPGDGHPPVWVKVYDEDRPKRKVIAAGRWPAMALTDPKAVVEITAIA